MKVAAIIAEYNPLHGGHQYHIDQTRQKTDADYIITILSGDFVQRGLPAIEEKFTRAGKALEAGSDLVLELPLPYALSSAEGFAFGGVSLADQLGCVDYLSFGLEDEGNLEAIKELAQAMNVQQPYQQVLKYTLQEGFSYPAAYAHAVAKAFPDVNTAFLTEKGNSNTILALEYLRALNRLESTIVPVAVSRQGMPYLSGYEPAQASAMPDAVSSDTSSAHDLYPSASALRAQLQTAAPSDSPLLFPYDFSSLLHYKLLSLTYEDLLQYRDMTPQLAHKTINALPEFRDYEQFANLLWTKDTTYSRICRELLYILLGIKKDTWDVHVQVPYARILGFRKSASSLLHQIREKAAIPLIPKLADAQSVLSGGALSLLDLEVRSSQIYDSVRCHKCDEQLPTEYQKQIVIF